MIDADSQSIDRAELAKLLAKVGEISADRNEWKAQHENLLSINRQLNEEIAALRQPSDEIDAGYALRMVYLMLRSLRAEIPPGRYSILDKDRLRNEVLDEAEARVGEMQDSESMRSERQPSSDQVLVPREPTQEMCDAFYNEEAISDGDCMTGFTAGYRAMLAAAEGDQ